MGREIRVAATLALVFAARVWAVAPPSSDSWDTRLVHLDERDASWKDGAKPGLFMIQRVNAEEPAAYPYGQALRGDALAGKLAVVGCFGTLFTNESRFEVTSFGRKENEITIMLTRHEHGGIASGPDQKVTGKYLFFTALLPRDLPDGHYTVKCTMAFADGTEKAPAPVTCAFDMSDPDPASDPMAALQKLSKAQLLAEYVAAGEALKDHGAETVELVDKHVVGMAMFESQTPRAMRFQCSEMEIERRGAEMVPLLVDMLKKEARRNPAPLPDRDYYQFGFARSLIKLLAQTHDGSAALAVADVLGTTDGTVNPFIRLAAKDALEEMTYKTFTHYTPSSGNYYLAVADDETLATKTVSAEDVNTYAKLSEKYKSWLAGEGKDSAQWLTLARARARGILATDQLEDCYCAASFLTAMRDKSPQDDQKDAVLKRVMNILAECKRVEDADPAHRLTYRWHDQQLPLSVDHWLSFVEQSGPAARPYYDALLPLVTESKVVHLAPFVAMGGGKSVARMMEMFGPLSEKAKATGLDLTTPWTDIKDDEKRRALLNYQECRWGITRWAGRIFGKDEDIAAWWNDNKGKTQEQWLRDGLESTAANADEGSHEAQGLLRIMLPDLPAANGEYPWTPPGSIANGDFRVKQMAPFRLAWLKQARDQNGGLSYDEQQGAFRLKR